MNQTHGRTLSSIPTVMNRAPLTVLPQQPPRDLAPCVRVRAADLAAAFDRTPFQCVLVDRDFQVLAVSRTLGERAIQGSGEGRPAPALQQILPDLAPTIEAALERLFAPADVRERKGTDAALVHDVRCFPLLAEGGEIAGAVIVVNAPIDLPLVDKRGLCRPLIGASEALRGVMEMVEAVAATNATVLVEGESGVGKELVARAIHERSRRAAHPLVTVNCASIPRDLFESEFFGHARGAFTGAHHARPGRLHLADRGTLFLDEVAEMPLDLQPKLLRVLQEREFEPVGDARVQRVDIRLIAATNRDLEAEVRAGRFRQDLYYRLAVLPIWVPPLRERPDDILVLAKHFVRTCAEAHDREGPALTEAHAQQLLAHAWPGNVRELHNVIERAVIQSTPGTLRIAIAPPRRESPPLPATRPFLTAAELLDHERENIVAALTMSRWRVSGSGGAAELLGMRPSTLRDRIITLGIRQP
jgi:transcriptional regulator of acetoin/glycerol metabolism